MSGKSDEKSTEDKSVSISSEIQTISSDQSSENNCSDDNHQSLEYFEDIPGLTLPSLLKNQCSYPTEMFYTLSPISMSRITSESTPITTNRRQPIGGENLLHQKRNHVNRVNTFTIGSDKRLTHDIQSPETSQPVTDRPPLIGQTNSSESNGSTTVSTRESDHTIGLQEMSSVDRDALANKVRQLLGKTRHKSNEEDVESLGLIQVIDDFDDKCSQKTIDSGRSEPDGKGKPLQSQNTQKIVYYSTSESEDNEEEEKENEIPSETSSTSNSSNKNNHKNDRRNQNSMDNNAIRNRSYSTGHKRRGVDISSIIRQRLQTKESFPTESCETQTNRSFLADQALHNQNTTRVKRINDVSKSIQTSDSLLTIQSNDKKELKEMSCQTNNSFGISSFLKELLKSQLKPRKISAGTQTMRSYLTEQALKQKNKEMKRQTNEKSRKTSSTTTLLETKAIQTSYTSSVTSESDSTLFNEGSHHSSANSRQKSRSLSLVRENKEPISWFIPIDKKTQNKNISRIYKSGQNYGMKTKCTEQMSAISSPVPLQEAFNRHCIDMRINSQIRVNRINTIADLRKRTADERLIEMAKQFLRQQESAKVIRAKVIQPVFKSTIKRFFTHEEMRAQTEKVYKTLPEVKAMRERNKQKEREKNQRLLSQIYKYKLKDNALKGRLTWKITQSCLN